MKLAAQHLPAQARLADKPVPFASDLVLWRPLSAPNPVQFLRYFVPGRRAGNEGDHQPDYPEQIMFDLLRRI